MGVACKLAGDGAPLPRRKRPYCNARKGNELPPPRSGPSIGRWRGRPWYEKQPQEGLRLALRFRDEPDAVAAESANSPRVEHAGEGWRPFAVPKAAALHLWRAVSSGLSYMPHSLVMQRTKEHELSEEFVELALGPPIFFGQTT